ncbi:MAG: 16S rRNA (cytosine(1402)-N(4))-methyltransferase, partial [Lachnospiraceae bacterium]|nr:16S rRNA (cytosine(1402)-N(4))-methyltransferase [Lachnospiraceae bacterium]
MNFSHYSVLLNETMEGLSVKPDGIYVDGTLGGGGHALEVVRRLEASGRFIGLDQDEAAIAASKERLEPFTDRVTIVRSNYADIRQVLKEQGITHVDG